jgi:hypothetical protein
MDFRTYQALAWRYDQHPDEPERALTVALLGLGGEVGTLQTNQKKTVRDGPVYVDSHALAVEDLGDIMWYAADAATWLGVNLEHVAEANLAKIADRWARHDRPMPVASPPVPLMPAAPVHGDLGPAHVFDGGHPATHERLPRHLEIHLGPMPETGGEVMARVLPVWDGRPCGDPLGDNAYDNDGYRYHDVFHFAHLAVLGWSPVIRALLRRKRKVTPRIDDVEDGGRAVAIEEGLSAFVFEAAARAGYYENVDLVDSDVLRLCRRMTSGLEVRICTEREWERAILDGYAAWRLVRQHGHAALDCNLDARTITARPLTSQELADHAAVCESAIAQRAAKSSGTAGT